MSDEEPEAEPTESPESTAPAASTTSPEAPEPEQSEVDVEAAALSSSGGKGGGLSGGKIAAIVVAVVLAAGFVVGLIASKHQKDDEKKSTSTAAATVDGVPISRSALDSEVRSWTANKDYVQAAAQQGQTMVGTNGQPTPAFERDILTQQIENVLFTREVNRRHLKVTAADEAQLRQQVSGNPALAKYPKAFLDGIIERAAKVTVLQRALTTPPTAAQVQAAYDAQYSCPSGKDVSHILLKTMAEANAVEAQLASGTDFATVAKAKSTDTGSAPNGGQLGCLKKGTYVKEFEDAAFAATPGTPTAPVKSQFGYHVILVTPHSAAATPPLASVRSQIVQQLQQNATQFNQFVDSSFAKAKVAIDPRFGVWGKTAQGYAVNAPTGTAPTTGAAAGGAQGSSGTTAPPPVANDRPHKP